MAMHLPKGKRAGWSRAFLLSLGVFLPWLVLVTLCPCLLGAPRNTGNAAPRDGACCSSCCPESGAETQKHPALPAQRCAAACCGTLQATLEKSATLLIGHSPGERLQLAPDMALSALLRTEYLRQRLVDTHALAPPVPYPAAIAFVRLVSRRCVPANAPPLSAA
jgi:hypothetical protein